MSGDNRHDTNGRGEAEKLLPWYLTGKLTFAEKAMVEARDAGGGSLGARLEEMAREADETIAVNEALGAPSAATFHRLMQSVAAEPRRETAAAARSGWRDALSKITAALTAPAGQKLAAAFAVLIIVTQAAVIWSWSGAETKGGSTYQTASGGKPLPSAGPGFIVTFDSSATMASVAELLDRTGASVADGPKPGGLYRIKAADPSKGFKPDAEATLKASRIVKMVLPER
jgi:anti-sigma factor RsiW